MPHFLKLLRHGLLSALAGAVAILLLSSCRQPSDETELVSDRTVILISLDGFRADYVARFEPPNLMKLAEEGVQAKYGMIPVFPTLTFPNHYTIATGLYPDHHNIIDNTILDRESGKKFTIYDREAIEDSFWWGGEPIWVTAEGQGTKTATFYWVGSEAPVKGVQPTYWKRFDASVTNTERVDQVLAWLDLPEEERPEFIGLYFGSVDGAGHDHGKDSDETKDAVMEADQQIGRLLDGLSDRGIADNINIVVLSDHGMSNRSQDRVLALDDYLDISNLEIVTTTPVLGINTPEGSTEAVVAALQGASPHLQIWAKEDIPDRYNYGEHPWIPDVIGLVEDGWTLYRERDYMKQNLSRLGGATHGYDPDAESMRALFIAHGPTFKSGLTIEPFENVHIYEMLAQILDIEPAQNDGDPAVLGKILDR